MLAGFVEMARMHYKFSKNLLVMLSHVCQHLKSLKMNSLHYNSIIFSNNLL